MYLGGATCVSHIQTAFIAWSDSAEDISLSTVVTPHLSETPADKQIQICHRHFTPALPSPFQVRLAMLFTEENTNTCRK